MINSGFQEKPRIYKTLSLRKRTLDFEQSTSKQKSEQTKYQANKSEQTIYQANKVESKFKNYKDKIIDPVSSLRIAIRGLFLAIFV